ncbi:MAG: restriction endonuclease subunit S [Alphaproteobacteria bacterium]|nr:restriction endonuclease subunit S [Alphaproteobacteria bacterium]
MLNLLKIKDVICAEIKGIWGDEPTPSAITTPVIKTNNMTYEGYISYDNLTYRVIPENKLRSSYLLNGDILIEKSGGTRTHSVGYVNIFESTDNKYVCNNFVIAIRPDKNKIVPKYLFYQMKHFYESGIFSDCYNKTTGIQNLKVSTYLDKKITCPDFTTQNQNVSFLDKIVGCISVKKEQLKQLDELVKSRFIEMFGDVKNNDKNFLTKQGSDLFRFSSGKFLEASKRLESGIPVYGGNGIAWYTSEPLINFATIVIGRVGAYCGNVRKISGSNWVTDNAIYIKEFKENCFNLEFLEELMCEYNFAQYNDAAAQPKITQKPMETLRYIVPPIELQNTFAEFVKQVDKSKFVVSLA